MAGGLMFLVKYGASDFLLMKMIAELNESKNESYKIKSKM